jgi:MYXO-CTERM domain-containing protein
MKSFRRFSVLAVLCIAACASPDKGDSAPPREHVGTATERVTSTFIHRFLGGAADGASPQGDVVVSGSTLYGVTLAGGTSGAGTVFKVGTDGTGFTLLRSFAGGDGREPRGSLVMSGATLYGMTDRGGASNSGTVFKVDTDGNNFALLHSFAGGAGDGQSAPGSLVVVGSTVYGMTKQGGASDLGTVFKVDTDGNNFAVLHSFAGGPADGQSPTGSLVASGGALYGMTYQGGASSLGTVFKIDTDGNNYTLLRSLGADAQLPQGSLVVSGSTLYGMTSQSNGVGMPGAVFKIDTDGNGYALLHSFTSNPDGSSPFGSLVVSGSTLYGMTNAGGAHGVGSMFKVNTDGSGYVVFGSFAGGAADGSYPRGALVASGSTLYGMTVQGGSTSNTGTVFKIDLALPCAINEHVSTKVCVACAVGYGRAAGDDPAGADTSCSVMTCAADQHVASNACVACAPGTTRPAGDPATGPNTACTAKACAVDEFVSSHRCIPCAAGSNRAAGDPATGADTTCATKTCANNEYVSNHKCLACAPGSARPAGDLATEADTMCTVLSDGGADGGGGDSGSDSGCSVTSPASSTSGREAAALLAAFGALLLAARRRRRT